MPRTFRISDGLALHGVVAVAAFIAGTRATHAQVTGTVLVERHDGSFVNRPAVFAFAQQGSSYTPRASTVLDNITGLFTSPDLQLLGSAHLLEDFTFVPGPWAVTTWRVAESFEYSFSIERWTNASTPGTSPPFKIRMKLYDGNTFNMVFLTNMIPASATQIGPELVVDYPVGAITNAPPTGYLTVYDATVTPGAGAYSFPSDGFLVDIGITSPTDPTSYALFDTVNQANPYSPPNTGDMVSFWRLVSNSKPIAPGNSGVGYGRDVNGDGQFLAGPESRSFVNGATGPRHLAFAVRGSDDPPPCSCRADFDKSGGTPDTNDIYAFFGAWILGDPRADVDCSGGTPDATDLTGFFEVWLAGGC